MVPADLLAAGRAEVAGYGVELIDDRAELIATVSDATPGGGGRIGT